METKDIKHLLKKFYDGETSSIEEKYLYQYFMGETILDELEREKSVFIEIYKQNNNIQTPEGLGEKIELLIDKLDSQNKKQVRWQWIIGIAASIILILSGLLYLSSESDSQISPTFADTYSNPTEAYIATQQTLIFASNKLNKSLAQIQTIQSDLEKMNKKTSDN